MGILSWIIFGGLAGWLASIVTGRNNRMGCLANIAVGLVGALIGGWLGTQLGMGSVSGFNLGSLALAVLGAVIFLLIIGFFQRGR
jgi:uncharacterized membrane protein YeaQ/YmgE (transglycosylase-associated protein family)